MMSVMEQQIASSTDKARSANQQESALPESHGSKLDELVATDSDSDRAWLRQQVKTMFSRYGK